MPTDSELLQELATFLSQRTFIMGDEASIRDMVFKYKNPPFTLLNRAAMRMTVAEFNYLNDLMLKVNAHLQSTLHKEEQVLDGNQ